MATKGLPQGFGQPKLSTNMFLLDPETDLTPESAELLRQQQEPFENAEDVEFSTFSKRVVLTEAASKRLEKHFLLAVKSGRIENVGILNGLMGDAYIINHNADDGKRKLMSLDLELYLNPPPPAKVTLMVAMCRKKVLGRVLETATAIGVKQIHIFNSERTEQIYWESSVNYTSPKTIRPRLIDGLQHTMDTKLPEVSVWRNLDEFIDSVLPTATQNALNLVAHPSETAQECPTKITGNCNLLIGPEGGFIDEEINKFKAMGFSDLSLGPRILPVETAVHVVLGKLCF